MRSRREILKNAAATSAAVAATSMNSPTQLAATEPKAQLKGHVKHSIAFWCFNARGEKWSAEKVCEVAKDLECASVELLGPEHWKALKESGLTCAIASNGTPASSGTSSSRHATPSPG